MTIRHLLQFPVLLAVGGLTSVQAQVAIDSFGVGKKADYLQTSAATPVSQAILGDPVGPYHFYGSLDGENLNLINNPVPRLSTPVGQYTLTGNGATLERAADFTTKSALDAAYPNGVYTFAAGNYNLPLSTGANDGYPVDIPRITNGNWDAQGRLLLGLEGDNPLNFSTFTQYASGTGGFVLFSISNLSGNTVGSEIVSTGSTALTGFINEPALTSYRIPINTLQTNRYYYAELSYVRIVNLNTDYTQSLGAVGMATFVNTTAFIINTASKPDVFYQGYSTTVMAGQSIGFSVVVTVTNPPPTYQWQRLAAGTATWSDLTDNSTYQGTKTSSLFITSASVGMNGDQFRIVVTNPAGSTAGSAIPLTVSAAGTPAIYQQPESFAVNPGGAAWLSVGGMGTAPLAFQWYRNGQPLAGGNTATITFDSVQPADVGTYTAVITNAGGSVTSNPVQLTLIPPQGVVAVAAGRFSSAFIKNDGSLWTMGAESGRDASASLRAAAHPKQIATNVVMVSRGWAHGAFVKADGTLWTVGSNEYGQLGDGSLSNRGSPVPVGTNVVSVACGHSHTLFLKSDGSLWGMGGNHSGQLGEANVGSLAYRTSPVPIAQNVASMATGYHHSLFIKSDGSLWVMGNNQSGQLALGTTTPQAVFAPVKVADGVAAAAAGSEFSVFLKTDGTLWGVGQNYLGQLGDGTKTNRLLPVLISSEVRSVDAGLACTFFIKTNGLLYGAGLNTLGVLGDGSNVDKISPSLLAADVASVDSSGVHTVFGKTDGSLWTVGYNDEGQLGNDVLSTLPLLTPVNISNGAVTPPVTPANLVVITDDAAGRRRLNWTPSLRGTRYEVWRNTVNDLASATCLSRNTTGALAYDNTVQIAPRYYYWIVAVNSGGSAASAATLFNNPVRAVPADFNADGKPDLLWSNSVTGERAIWLMNGTNLLGISTLGIFPLEWTIAATGDFNADGKPDIVWSNSLTNERAIWLMDGTNFLGASTLGVFPPEWTVAATGDFNFDGKPDLVWSNSLTGERALWLMNGTNLLGVSTLGVFPLEWTVAATGDFNADGKPDLVWSNSITGERALWLMDGTMFIAASTLGIFPHEWTVAGTADFNADNQTDLIWSNSVTGERALWLMNGTNFLGASTLGIFPLEWTVSN